MKTSPRAYVLLATSAILSTAVAGRGGEGGGKQGRRDAGRMEYITASTMDAKMKEKVGSSSKQSYRREEKRNAANAPRFQPLDARDIWKAFIFPCLFYSKVS